MPDNLDRSLQFKISTKDTGSIFDHISSKLYLVNVVDIKSRGMLQWVLK